ncbi:MAG: ribonuclease III [Cytophagales bacterium]|nr:ribonuclease III [Cytophagales bacterium]
MLGFVADLFNFSGSADKQLGKAVRQITGSRPRNLRLYKLALQHTSAAREINASGFRESNERLEYLGDAILGAVIADFLFKKFPFKEEGFLTEIRSRIVNRESLNALSKKIGLNQLIVFDGNRRTALTHKSMHGDALEALVGAIYLDKGFEATRRFIIQRLLKPHFDLENIVQNNPNYKSLMIEWAQRANKKLHFQILEERGALHNKEFIAQVIVDGQPIATGSGYSKKKAEQAAAEKACEMLEAKKSEK